MNMLPPILLSSSNLLLHASLSLFLTLLLSLLKIPSFFLYGLHTYIHPDDVTPNNSNKTGIRAAIRRPGASEPELKPRKKSKEKFEFDENKAQIFRLKLNDAHLQSRLHFKKFQGAFSSTVVATSCLLLHQFLKVKKDSGVLENATVIPVLLGFMGVCRVIFLISRVSFERSASKRLDKQCSLLLGILGFLLGLMIVYGIFPNWVLDFGFEFLDGFGKFALSAFMGCLTGLLYMPAARSARAFWLGTDQGRSYLSIISCGWIERILLYANYLLTIFTTLLWLNLFSELLVNKNANGRKGSISIDSIGYPDELVGNVGMSRLDFENFRLWCLLVSGVLQMVTLRSNLQIFLNEAVLSWYQRLHASKVPDMEFSRAKVFLHNHYLCLVALQFFAPSALVLLFLGLSQIGDVSLENFQMVCGLLPCSALIKEVALFMAWWVIFVWTIFTAGSLTLYQRGILYVS